MRWKCSLCDLWLLKMTTVKAFNCIANSTTIQPLKRPYYCCGWYAPPKSFSGTYIIYKTGSTQLKCGVDDICTGPNGIPIKLELETECGGGYFGGNGAYTYIWKSQPNYLVYGFVSLQLCNLPDGSNPPIVLGLQSIFAFEDPHEEGEQTSFECSYDLNTKQFNFNFKSTFFADFGNGDTFYRYVELDKVEMK